MKVDLNKRKWGIKMANLRLKKLILEVVDNQLRDNDPPVVQETFGRLIGMGYSAREAKEKSVRL